MHNFCCKWSNNRRNYHTCTVFVSENPRHKPCPLELRIRASSWKWNFLGILSSATRTWGIHQARTVPTHFPQVPNPGFVRSPYVGHSLEGAVASLLHLPETDISTSLIYISRFNSHFSSVRFSLSSDRFTAEVYNGRFTISAPLIIWICRDVRKMMGCVRTRVNCHQWNVHYRVHSSFWVVLWPPPNSIASFSFSLFMSHDSRKFDCFANANKC